jgi:hypothetical protein
VVCAYATVTGDADVVIAAAAITGLLFLSLSAYALYSKDNFQWMVLLIKLSRASLSCLAQLRLCCLYLLYVLFCIVLI